ncbi:MAG TPA: YfhO family protein, partial [Pyrinomonadaceae bacterium]
AFAYPLTWGYLFLPGHWAEQVYVLAPFLLSPIFTYAYAREVGCTRTASLLAGLAYAYGGATTGLLGVVGFFTNAMMWLPLLLVAVERARAGRRFALCLSAASAAYAMCVLTGLAQGFVYVALVAAAYALALALSGAPRLLESDDAAPPREPDAQGVVRSRFNPARSWASRARAWTTWTRWRPVAAAAGAIALGAGVGAFQILETMRAVRRSIRRTLIYPFFVSGSFSPRVAFKSLVAPLYIERFADVGTYVAPLVLLLAFVAVFHALRRTTTADASSSSSPAPRRDPRVLFWAATALVSFVFILGQHTPVYGWLYHVPVVNSFRVPSRFAFVWTFAAAILAAYGWDALVTRARATTDMRAETTDTRARETTGTRALAGRRNVALVCGLFAASALVGFFWWRETVRTAVTDFDARAGVPRAWTEGFWYAGLPVSSYLVWKLAFTVLTLLLVWRTMRIDATRARTLALTCVLALVCFVEPFIFVSNCWRPFAKSRARFEATSHVTRLLQAKTQANSGEPSPPARVYTRVKLFAEEFNATPRFDPPNLTALYGLENAGGYEPLILERYSRALGNVHLDAASPLPGFAPNLALFDARSHLLDLLGVRFVVNAEMPTGAPAVEREGVRFNPDELATELRPGESISLEVTPAAATADTLALVTSMSNSATVADGATVAQVLIHTKDGRVFERHLRAGRDTAEWAHERPDVRASIRHALAPVFDSNAVEDAGVRYSSHRYWTRIALGESLEVERVEIVNATKEGAAALALWKATLYDTARRESRPLARTQRSLYAKLDATRWSIADDAEDVLVVENRRALPRAWLVGEAAAVDGEEALRRINGESPTPFDPRRTALLEVAPTELPALAGGELNADSTARVVEYEPNRLVVETNADRAALLVLGEINYPGWGATVDGAAAQVYATDYLLRGVHVPAGTHRVEMRYTAPAARNGAFISICSLLVLCGLLIYARPGGWTDKRN